MANRFSFSIYVSGTKKTETISKWLKKKNIKIESIMENYLTRTDEYTMDELRQYTISMMVTLRESEMIFRYVRNFHEKQPGHGPIMVHLF